MASALWDSRSVCIGADPNIVESSDISPLMKTATLCNHRVMRALLKRGAKVNQKDSTGRTALINAIDVDCLLGVATIFSMRKGDVDLDAMDESFQTARDYARNPWIKTLLENVREEKAEPETPPAPVVSLP